MRASSRTRTFPLFVPPRKPGASVVVRDNGQRLQITLPAMMALGGRVVMGALDKRYPIDFEASRMRAYLFEERARGVLRVTDRAACIEAGLAFMQRVLQPDKPVRPETVAACAAGHAMESSRRFTIIFAPSFLIQIGAMVRAEGDRPLISKNLRAVREHYRKVFRRPVSDMLDWVVAAPRRHSESECSPAVQQRCSCVWHEPFLWNDSL